MNRTSPHLGPYLFGIFAYICQRDSCIRCLYTHNIHYILYQLYKIDCFQSLFMCFAIFRYRLLIIIFFVLIFQTAHLENIVYKIQQMICGCLCLLTVFPDLIFILTFIVHIYNANNTIQRCPDIVGHISKEN